MSFDFAAAKNAVKVNTQALTSQEIQKLMGAPRAQGPRARKRAAREKLRNGGIVASLLAAEGIATAAAAKEFISNHQADLDLNPMVGSSAELDGERSTSSQTSFSTTDLLAIQSPNAVENDEIIEVFDAVNGDVFLEGSVINFISATGAEGDASFKYLSSDGRIREYEFTVDGQGNDGNNGNGHGKGGKHASDPIDEEPQAPTEPTPTDPVDPDPTDPMDPTDPTDPMDPMDPMDPGHDMPHPDDPAKASEHMAAMALVPVNGASHVAVTSGSWFDPATWANGEVPGEGATVVIPHGISVAYDGESSASIFTVRVDGALEFATDRDTFLEVDTMFVSGNGLLTIGTADNPVAENVQAVVSIADNGPIDIEWDPMLLSRGVIGHGEVQIHGAEKETHLKVATDPMAGDTSITLEGAPDGWQVGDNLVLTGTHLTENFIQDANGKWVNAADTQDEELVITKIDGNTIYFDKPLQYDHDGVSADLKAYVANYTRNIRFETENANNVPVSQRGHVMFMHSDNIDVYYAEFYELGRTDKSERAFDAGDIENIAPDSNVKGRYSLHIHRAGVDNLDDPAMVVGNAVWGSPGWGYVHHDSNAILADNAAYDIFGAAFVAETGNETGRWVSNIAIKSIGLDHLAKDKADVEAFDFGRTGAGFWFQGRLVDAIDNIAAGMPTGDGFVYLSRGNTGDIINVDAASVDQPETLRYLDGDRPNRPAITQFEGNEAFAVEFGLSVIKANPRQAADNRSLISDFTAWEVQVGIHLEYTGHYTLSDLTLIGTRTDLLHETIGLEYNSNVFDIVVNGAEIDGFDVGAAATRKMLSFDANSLDYIFIDVNVSGATTEFRNFDGDMFLTSADLVDGRFEVTSAYAEDIPYLAYPTVLNLDGSKVDSIGATTIAKDWDPASFDSRANLRGLLESEGYWTLPDGRTVTVIEQYVSDRATGELFKFGVVVEVNPINLLTEDEGGFLRIAPEYNGVLDLNSLAPNANDDNFTLSTEGAHVLDVLANDSDPDGDALVIDGLVQPTHGYVTVNDDNTITYNPDPGYTGDDEFWYWADDGNGNFSKATVHVSVEI